MGEQAGSQEDREPVPVKVVDIDMPFFSMVNFMAKAVFALIPALLVVCIIAASAALMIKFALFP